MMEQAQQKFECIFTGTVHPARCAVSISRVPIEVEFSAEGIAGDVCITIDHSVIMATFTSGSEIHNIATVRNIVLHTAQSLVDALSFELGCAYDVEITSYINVSEMESVTIPVVAPAVAKTCNEYGVDFVSIVNVYSSKDGRYLQRCLADLREALRNPKGVGFYCYRAIESLRQYFIVEHGVDDGASSWEVLRNVAEVTRDELNEIKKFADPIRHGGDVYISGESSAKMLKMTWGIVCKYILFAQGGYIVPT